MPRFAQPAVVQAAAAAPCGVNFPFANGVEP